MALSEKTHYELLGVTASSTRSDIEKAYIARKADGSLSSQAIWSLERAYFTLSDPNQKRRYDAALERRRKRTQRAAHPPDVAAPRRPLALPKWQLPAAVAGVALFALIFWLRVWPLIGWRFITYSPGTALAVEATGTPFGTVLEYDSAHDFGRGVTAKAYRVKLADGGERWLTRREINQLARPAGR